MAFPLPSALSNILRPVSGLYGARPQVGRNVSSIDVGTPQDLYRVLRAYYANNALYDALADLMRREATWREALKPYRNPAYRAVEWYPSALWPGDLPEALPIVTENEAIVEPIQQVWKWSAWASKKQTYARQLALFGDGFIKVASTQNRQRVYMQLIEPEYVTDFDTDERGFLQWIRLDIPQSRRLPNNSTEWYWYTEIWDAPDNSFKIWEQRQSALTPPEQLGQPTRQQSITSFGIDFVPIVHAKFMDVGDDRGMSPLVPVLDKIDEANRQATRLSQMLFRHNDVTWALEANSVDATGRPLPPPRLPGENEQDANAVVVLGDERFIKLPGMSKLVPLVPAIQYDAALSVLQDHMRELEMDLPELVAYRIPQEGELSGRAVRLMLAPAIKRLEEARGNGENAMARAHQMALTIGAGLGLFGDLGGDFDSGAFEHTFEPRDVLPADDMERAQTEQLDATAVKAYTEAGVPVEKALQQVLKWTDEEVAEFVTARTAAVKREQALVMTDTPEGEGEEPGSSESRSTGPDDDSGEEEPER